MASPPPLLSPASSHIPELDQSSRALIEAQVARLLSTLLTVDIHDGDFKATIDAIGRHGHKEIVEATRLHSAFAQRQSRYYDSNHACLAIASLRAIMYGLDPARQGDLRKQVKILGLFPGRSRLDIYLRQFESAGKKINQVLRELALAQDELERDLVSLEDSKVQLAAILRQLKAAEYLATFLQEKLEALLPSLALDDPSRARALQQEALVASVRTLESIVVQQAITLNGYLILEPLKVTAYALFAGISHLNTSGMSVIKMAQAMVKAVAQPVAHASGEQRKLQDQSVPGLPARGHATRDPENEIRTLQLAFDDIFEAIDQVSCAAVRNPAKT
ncbi:MAG: toxic anion resistance protein [Pseudomonadota bacterium]